MICPNCANEYDNQGKYPVCYDCYQNVGCYGDEENYRGWWAWNTLVNMDATPEELEAWMDSPAIQSLLWKMYDRWDMRCRENFAIKFVDKYIKEKK